MVSKHYDIIIIGGGLSGLYSGYLIKTKFPNTSFVIFEKNQKKDIGGRAGNKKFYGIDVVTGAGVGRFAKDKLLLKLLRELNIPIHEYMSKIYYSKLIEPVDIKKIMDYLRADYNRYKTKPNKTFKEYASSVLGDELYQKFIVSSGYTDYENEDIYETLYYYGMDDNSCCWKGFMVPWKKLVDSLCNEIGMENIKTYNGVKKITKVNDGLFSVKTDKDIVYTCNKIIIATTISGIQKLLKYKIYDQIKSQPFLRLYGKFTQKSIPIMKEYVKGYIIVPGPLQKMIPMDPNKGIYMIAYSDNESAIFLKKYLDNTLINRNRLCRLIELSLGIPENSIQLSAIMDFYWNEGTHYYEPLDKKLYKNREDFIYQAQHPEDGIIVASEAVSRDHGWTEGALDSVKLALTNKWIKTEF